MEDQELGMGNGMREEGENNTVNNNNERENVKRTYDRPISHEEYIKVLKAEEVDKSYASKLQQKINNNSQSKNPIKRFMVTLDKLDARWAESQVIKRREQIDQVKEMFEGLDRAEASKVYDYYAENAYAIGNSFLADELLKMKDREIPQAIEEYGVAEKHSTDARLCEQIANFEGNQFKKPLEIDLKPAAGAVTISPLNKIFGGNRYLDSKVDRDEVSDRITYLYRLLGFSDHIDQIPSDFTKEAGSQSVSQSREYKNKNFSDELNFKFVFKRPYTRSLGPDSEMTYFPPSAKMIVNKTTEI